MILHVGTNELKFESPPERKIKSVIGVAKYLQTDTLSVSAYSTWYLVTKAILSKHVGIL